MPVVNVFSQPPIHLQGSIELYFHSVVYYLLTIRVLTFALTLDLHYWSHSLKHTVFRRKKSCLSFLWNFLIYKLDFWKSIKGCTSTTYIQNLFHIRILDSRDNNWLMSNNELLLLRNNSYHILAGMGVSFCVILAK